MGKIKITQVRSAINRPEKQKRTLKALGIRKMGHSVMHNSTPQVLGMINKINHLLKIEETA